MTNSLKDFEREKIPTIVEESIDEEEKSSDIEMATLSLYKNISDEVDSLWEKVYKLEHSHNEFKYLIKLGIGVALTSYFYSIYFV